MDQDHFWVLDLGFGLNQGLHHLFADIDHDREAVIDMFPRGNTTNPGNTLYVMGLSSRVTEKDHEIHFSKEGKVSECYLIVEPRTCASRGFAFVTMGSVEDAQHCIKYLNQSILEGRYITVEKKPIHQLCCSKKLLSSSIQS